MTKSGKWGHGAWPNGYSMHVAVYLMIVTATPQMHIEANVFAANLQAPGVEPKGQSACIKCEAMIPQNRPALEHQQP